MSFAWSKVPDISYFQLYRNQSIYLLWKPMIGFFIIKIRKDQQLLLAGLTDLSTTISLKKYQSIHWNVFWSISQNIEFTELIINRWQVVQWKHSRFWQISMGNPVELGFYEYSNIQVMESVQSQQWRHENDVKKIKLSFQFHNSL